MITGSVIGREAVLFKLDGTPKRVRDELKPTIERLAIELQSYIQKNKLSGQVLKNRTGKLRRSITYRITSNKDGITAQVGTNTEYAAAHEYGFDGVVNVRAHTRRLASFNAKGKQLGRTKKGRLRSGKEIYHTFADVKAHTMHMRMPERSFLRSALADMQDKIRTEIRASLTRGLR